MPLLFSTFSKVRKENLNSDRYFTNIKCVRFSGAIRVLFLKISLPRRLLVLLTLSSAHVHSPYQKECEEAEMSCVNKHFARIMLNCSLESRFLSFFFPRRLVVGMEASSGRSKARMIENPRRQRNNFFPFFRSKFLTFCLTFLRECRLVLDHPVPDWSVVM